MPINRNNGDNRLQEKQFSETQPEVKMNRVYHDDDDGNVFQIEGSKGCVKVQHAAERMSWSPMLALQAWRLTSL